MLRNVHSTRRSLAMVSSVLILVLAALPGLARTASDLPQKPNVIFILTDDQGYGDLACHGNPIIKTPNLDRLHGESIRFTDFHVSPTCSPTRALLDDRAPRVPLRRDAHDHRARADEPEGRDHRPGAQVGRLHHRASSASGTWATRPRISRTSAASTRSSSTAAAASARRIPAVAATPRATPTSIPPSCTTACSRRRKASAPTSSSGRPRSGSTGSGRRHGPSSPTSPPTRRTPRTSAPRSTSRCTRARASARTPWPTTA